MEMKDLLDRLHKAIDGLAQTDAPSSGDGRTEMTPDQFLAYATDQIEKAAKDPAEVKKARLAHLKGQIASVAKNYEGSTPVPGPFKIEQYKSSDQNVSTSTEKAPGNNAPATSAASNFASGDTPAPVSGAGSQPSGGQNPPITAGGSGFASPEAATFAKAVDTLTAAVSKMEEATPAAPPGKDPAQVPTQTSKPVEKSIGVIWPMDMNSGFGRGEKEVPESPEWGYDSGSTAARVFAEKSESKGKDAPGV